MKRTCLLFILALLAIALNAQDIIIKKDGKRFNCKILSVDSSSVSVLYGQPPAKYIINRSEIKEIHYYADRKSFRPEIPNQRNALTIGFLEGGGSLLGVDYEHLIGKNGGVQFGAGHSGYGFGINIHFKPTTRSSYFSLQYWHQGFGDYFTQSLLGPCLVLRARKIITAQIGLGVPLKKGPNWPDDHVQPDLMLTYAIGLYTGF